MSAFWLPAILVSLHSRVKRRYISKFSSGFKTDNNNIGVQGDKTDKKNSESPSTAEKT